MTAPKSQKAHILFFMIHGPGVSEQNTRFNGFRTRISELRKHLTINTKRMPFTSQFGKKGYYNFHYLTEKNKKLAVLLYEKINT